jgi:hypothetical protein
MGFNSVFKGLIPEKVRAFFPFSVGSACGDLSVIAECYNGPNKLGISSFAVWQSGCTMHTDLMQGTEQSERYNIS